jgi:hypothetical protein
MRLRTKRVRNKYVQLVKACKLTFIITDHGITMTEKDNVLAQAAYHDLQNASENDGEKSENNSVPPKDQLRNEFVGDWSVVCSRRYHKKKIDMESRYYVVSNFISAAGEPITWVENREIWNGMCKTNNSKLPRFHSTLRHLSVSHHTDITFNEDKDQDMTYQMKSEGVLLDRLYARMIIFLLPTGWSKLLEASRKHIPFA